MPRRGLSPLLAIFLVVLVDVLGLTIIIPLLPFYAQHFGATPFQVGLLSSVYSLCQLFAGPALGRLSDRVGRRPVLLVSQIGTFAGFILLATAPSLPIVFLSRVIDGTTAGNLTVAQAYIADVTPPRDRARGFALIGIAFGIGFLVGPALGGALAHHGQTLPILVAAGLSLLSVVATATILPTTPVAADAAAARRASPFAFATYRPYLARPGLGLVLLQFFLFCFGFAAFSSGFALFGERRVSWHGVPFGPREVGFTLAWAGFLGILVQGGLVGRLVTRFGEARVALGAFVTSAVAFVCLAATHGLALLALSTTLAALGTGPLRPALSSLISQRAGAAEQGLVLGLSQSLNSVAQVLAPLVGTWLIGRGALGAWAGLSAGVFALGALLALRSLRPPLPNP